MGNSLAAQSPLRESLQEGEQPGANQGSGLPQGSLEAIMLANSHRLTTVLNI